MQGYVRSICMSNGRSALETGPHPKSGFVENWRLFQAGCGGELHTIDLCCVYNLHILDGLQLYADKTRGINVVEGRSTNVKKQKLFRTRTQF